MLVCKINHFVFFTAELPRVFEMLKQTLTLQVGNRIK